jgi:hypothetical protein
MKIAFMRKKGLNMAQITTAFERVEANKKKLE